MAEEKKQLKWGTLLAYGQGGAIYNVLGNAVAAFAMYVLNIGLGISPTLVGTALAVPRLYDAVTDPIMKKGSKRGHVLIGKSRRSSPIGETNRFFER